MERSKDGGQHVSPVCTFIITLLPEALRLPKIKLNATVKLGVTDDFETVSHAALLALPHLQLFQALHLT